MADPEPTPDAIAQAKRHVKLAEAHERKVAQWDDQAAFLDERGDTRRADFARREADLERDAAREEWDRAAAIQGPTQFTEPKTGEPVEIPIPTRDAFLRGLEKVAPPADAGGSVDA
jgi:FAD/FMN-containing dehydrogenase